MIDGSDETCRSEAALDIDDILPTAKCHDATEKVVFLRDDLGRRFPPDDAGGDPREFRIHVSADYLRSADDEHVHLACT